LGVLEVSGNDADNDEGHIAFGAGGGNFVIDDNFTGNTGRVFFEARFKTATIADDGCAFFLGLGLGPVAAEYLTDNAGALVATGAFIGLQRLNDDGDKADIIFQEVSQTLQQVTANALTLVANTWYKFGFTYDPSRENAKKIKFYLDGAEQSTYVTATQINAATFPESVALQPMLLTKVGTAAEAKFSLDWVCATQYFDSV
jgi:hypothetical protein